MRAVYVLPNKRNTLVSKNDTFQLSVNDSKSEFGPMRNTVIRKSEIKNNGSILQIKERKEDSYIHPAFENSVAFSNISGIFGQQTFNNHELLSMKDDSFANEYEDLKFESNLEKELNWKSEKKNKHTWIPSEVDTISEDEYRAGQKENNIVYLKMTWRK